MKSKATKVVKFKQNKIKLPDVIIAATAIVNKVLLVTADKDFEKVSNLNLLLLNIRT